MAMAGPNEDPVPAPTAQTESPAPAECRYIGPARRGILIVDHQNVVGQFKHLGFYSIDPEWIVRLAQRVSNCTQAVLVTDLAITNPMTQIQYLQEVELWSTHGFKIVHVPAKFQRVSGETNGNGETASRRKDLTDYGIREEIVSWCEVPGVTDLLLFTQDVDFTHDVQNAAWANGKRIVLFTTNPDGVAKRLKQFAAETLNVLGYASAYSVVALDARHFWRYRENPEKIRARLRSWFATADGLRRNAYLLRQLYDMKAVLEFLVENERLVPPGTDPDSRRHSWRLLRNAFHEHLKEEKSYARLQLGVPLPEPADRNSLEATERELVLAQTRQCQVALDDFIRIWLDNRVLEYTAVQREKSDNITKLFYVNTEHPAVKVLLETDLP